MTDRAFDTGPALSRGSRLPSTLWQKTWTTTLAMLGGCVAVIGTLSIVAVLITRSAVAPARDVAADAPVVTGKASARS